ncbi:MAG: hypothetical protein ACR2MB_04870 [Acidimicrobiales bacterium]
MAASVGQRLWLNRHSWFYLDDWPLALQASHVGNFVRPYNGHLSVVLLSIYRAQMELFGFRTYLPLRLAGALSLAAVPVAVFLAVRRGRSALVAALVALPLVWFRHMTLEPAALNHYLSAAFGGGCAWALSHRPSLRHDLLLGVLLALALCSADGGVAVAAACLVHAACTRAPWRRWVAVAVPTAMWALWWLHYSGRAKPPNTSDRLGVGGVIRAVAANVVGSFHQLALGNRVVGVVLLAGFVAWGIAVIWRHGLAGGAGVLAWSTALVVWWMGLALSRGRRATPALEFRYAYLAATFILLAAVSSSGTGGGRRTRNLADGAQEGPRFGGRAVPARILRSVAWLETIPAPASAVVVVVVAALLALAVQGDLQRSSHGLAQAACSARLTVATADQGPTVVPDDVEAPITMYFVRAGQIRALTARYGHPFPPGEDPAAAVGPACF